MVNKFSDTFNLVINTYELRDLPLRELGDGNAPGVHMSDHTPLVFNSDP